MEKILTGWPSDCCNRLRVRLGTKELCLSRKEVKKGVNDLKALLKLYPSRI